jgi:asparagine synthase (glutamine-hydrolysing)
MSGICGIVRFDGDPRGLDEISRMTTAMPHRGPDGVAHWRDVHVALGHCLLRSTEEAAEEAQPLANEDGSIVLVMDGTLWNAPDLRAELLSLGAHLRTRADSELVLRSYQTWGQACLAHIDGDFALAIYDRRSRELFCARDRIGMRPLYYHAAGWGLCFASDPDALIALSFVPRRLNEARIADALVGLLEGYDLTSSFWLHVCRLPPAHELILKSGSIRINRYWQFEAGPILRLKSDAEYEEGFRCVMKEAVRRRLRGVKTTGSMLSGGVDSSTVTAFAGRLREEAGTGPHTTFSAVGPDPATCGETRAIYESAKMRGLDPHFVDYTALGDLKDEMANLTLNPPTLFDCHMTLIRCVYLLAHRSGMRAVLDGVGGDNVLSDGGLVPYLIRRGRFLSAYRESRDIMGRRRPDGGRSLFLRSLRMALAPQIVRDVRLNSAIRRIDGKERRSDCFINPDFAERVALPDRFRRHFLQERRPFRPGSPANRAAYFLTSIMPVARERYEREASRLHIEPRDPFLDREVIAYCTSLPPDQVTRNSWPKSILRRAMKNDLPASVLWKDQRTQLGPEFTETVVAAAGTFDKLLTNDKLAAVSNFVDANRARMRVQAATTTGESDQVELHRLFKVLFLSQSLDWQLLVDT